MDVAASLALAAAIDHELPSLVQELMLERERKAMQLEDLAVQGMTGMIVANLDMIHSRVDHWGVRLNSWQEVVDMYAEVAQADGSVLLD